MKHARMDRRDLLKSVTALGLTLSITVSPAQAESPDQTFNNFVRIAPDGTVTVVVPNPDMGQGVKTSLAMMVADELDADWQNIRIEQAERDPYAPGRNISGPPLSNVGRMISGGSRSIPANWDDLRQAGAAARFMLIQAASKTWRCPSSEIRTDAGYAIHVPSGRKASYGSLALSCTDIAPPLLQNLKLKDAKAYRVIGSSLPNMIREKL